MRSASGLPFDDIRNLMNGLPGPDKERWQGIRSGLSALAWPAASFGRLVPMTEWLAAWQAEGPQVLRPLLAIFAATHGAEESGIAGEGDLPAQKEVDLIAAGGAPVNQVALEAGLGLKVFDLALDYPTPNAAGEDALDEAGCAATMAFGMEAIAGGTDLLCLGAVGRGNRVLAGALAAALMGGKADRFLDEPTDAQRRFAEEACARVQGTTDPLEFLRRLGGREMAAIAGAILAARYQRIPVLLDGFVSTAAAAVLLRANERALDHCMAAHAASPKHADLLSELGLKPILDYGIGAENGLGAALAVSHLKQAAAAVRQTVTREAAGVS